jgi:hypothetical protein
MLQSECFVITPPSVADRVLSPPYSPLARPPALRPRSTSTSRSSPPRGPTSPSPSPTVPPPAHTPVICGDAHSVLCCVLQQQTVPHPGTRARRMGVSRSADRPRQSGVIRRAKNVHLLTAQGGHGHFTVTEHGRSGTGQTGTAGHGTFWHGRAQPPWPVTFRLARPVAAHTSRRINRCCGV